MVNTFFADTITYKHLAHLLSEKWSSTYSVVMGRLCCSLGFSLLRSSVMCIRGSHSRSKRLCVPPAVDLAVAKRHLSPLEQGDPYLNGMVFLKGYANFLNRSLANFLSRSLANFLNRSLAKFLNRSLKSGTVPLYLIFL